jgi:aldehyde:ferredoxin oxidoreductase
MQGNGVTYATCPMGADHTAGNLVGAYLGKALDPLAADGQVEASRDSQISMAALDCTGLCMLAGGVLAVPEVRDALLKMINAKCGSQLGPQDYQDMGMRVLKAEREFNRKAGFTNKDDRLAAFFYEEPLPPHNKVFIVSDEDLDSTFDF